MKTDYDPVLVEQAVFLAVRKNASLERELHRATEPLYEMPPGEARETRFHEIYAAFFSRLGLDSIVSTLLAEPDCHDLFEEGLGRCVVRRAAHAKAESAELFVRPSDGTTTRSDRTLIIQVQPQSLLDHDHLVLLMRRELLHVADMLDERFGYHPEAIEGLAARQNLIRDRYRVLWDIYVEGRLCRRGVGDERMAKRLETLFDRAFALRGTDADRAAFVHVYRAGHLTHDRLLAWAGSPETLLTAAAEPSPGSPRRPGEACPLCGFPTYDWLPLEDACVAHLVAAIHAQYPAWRRELGVCRQCAELHAAAPIPRSS